MFLQKGDTIVAIRNAEGIDKIKANIEADFATFLRLNWFPNAMCVILDGDDQLPVQRFSDCTPLLSKQDFPVPGSLGSVTTHGGKQSGVFLFPGSGISGTIEDVLLPIAQRRFSELSEYSRVFVDGWKSRSGDFKELKKPSGLKKAQLSAMVALLKPGKNTNASLDDQKWIVDPKKCKEIEPLIRFLSAALAEE